MILYRLMKNNIFIARRRCHNNFTIRRRRNRVGGQRGRSAFLLYRLPSFICPFVLIRRVTNAFSANNKTKERIYVVIT